MQTGRTDRLQPHWFGIGRDLVIVVAGFALIGWSIFALNEGAFISLGLSLGGMTIAAVGGRRLPTWARLLITGTFVIQGFWLCLVERTASPGLTLAVLRGMVFSFGLFALLPLLMTFCIWSRRTATFVVIGGTAVCLISAASLASIEESLFVAKHRETGAALTSRWLIPGNALWYDAEKQQLYACD